MLSLQTLTQTVKTQGTSQKISYSIGRLLGKGGFAKAYEVVGQPSAIKVISKQILKKPKAMQKLRSEISIHRSLDHPHVVKFKTSFEDN